MAQVISTWIDLLCSGCYSVLRSKLSPLEFYGENYLHGDEPLYCEKCDDLTLVISVMKQESDTRLETADTDQCTEQAIPHGVKIIHIGGVGIRKNLEPLPTGSLSKTHYYDFTQRNSVPYRKRK